MDEPHNQTSTQASLSPFLIAAASVDGMSCCNKMFMKCHYELLGLPLNYTRCCCHAVVTQEAETTRSGVMPGGVSEAPEDLAPALANAKHML